MDSQIEKVKALCARVSCNLFGKQFNIRVERDNLHPKDGRIFLQLTYSAVCTKEVGTELEHTSEEKEWHGRKWYLSEFMTDDEVIKTCYGAFKMCVEHEIMESFKVDGKILFNPHVNYLDLLDVSHKEVSRT
jgi:hypothetical protein